jgi:hypothetical protein
MRAQDRAAHAADNNIFYVFIILREGYFSVQRGRKLARYRFDRFKDGLVFDALQLFQNILAHTPLGVSGITHYTYILRRKDLSVNYSTLIASTGQLFMASRTAGLSGSAPSLTLALKSPLILNASGANAAQVPQPMHFSLFIFILIYKIFYSHAYAHVTGHELRDL